MSIFAICDKDEKYLLKMQEYLIEKRIGTFDIEVFTSVDKAAKRSQEEHMEILLVDEELYHQDIKNVIATHIFILQENEVVTSGEFQGIDKYQSTESLIKEIFGYISNNDINSNKYITGCTRTNLICFYTPGQKEYQSSYAMERAMEDSVNGKKVLYIDLKEYSSVASIWDYNYDTDVSDLIYYALSHPNKLFYRIEGIKRTYNGVDIIPPPNNYEDIIGIEKDEWLKIIDLLISIGKYDEIFLDMSEICRGLYPLLQKSYEVYTIIDIDEKSKWENYSSLLQKKKYEDILAKTVLVEVK